MIYNSSCKEERKEIVEHTYSKSISMVLTHLSKLFEINLKLYFNLRLSADAVYPKLKICFMGKCVDLPPDNLCSLMLTDFLESLTNLFLLQAQHQHNKCANAEPNHQK